MNYHVFNKDNPSTWPKFNCPILVFKPNNNYPCIYQWDNNNDFFINHNEVYEPDKCFYKYIGYVPYIEKEFHPMKCTKEDDKCEYEDDGYCLCKRKCKYKHKTTEYLLGYKRILKNF